MMMLCRRYVKNQGDAEERLQDRFYKFFKKLPVFNYQGKAALFAWLKNIMINECLMQLRKKNVFSIVSESAATDLILEADAPDNLYAGEIFNLLVQLPVGYRRVFNLYSIEGMAHKEIPALLGIAEGTSKSQLSKAKSLLQKLLLAKGNEYVKRQSK